MIKTFTQFIVAKYGQLTPEQKFRAMRDLGNDESLFRNIWFILFMLSLALVLTVLLLVIRHFRIAKERQRQVEMFEDNCSRYGLNTYEKTIFKAISDRAGLKRKNNIFTMADVFDNGAAKLMQEVFSQGLDLEERKKLNAAVNSIKQKLGYKKKVYSAGVRDTRGKSLSSRQIKEGKKVSLTGGSSGQGANLDAYVMDNNDVEFIVRTEKPVTTAAGDEWQVHYRYGSAVWQFNSLTLSSEDDRIVLSHSDNIKFINRRRFLRVKVNLPALVARFPSIGNTFSPDRIGLAPKFFKANVTELSGPGIRLESRIKLRTGERALVVFKLSEDKVVEDIAEVRGISELGGNRFSMGLELVGLNDHGVDTLVKATNNAAVGSSLAGYDEKDNWENGEVNTSEIHTVKSSGGENV
jgi:hypothetical protein